MQIRLQQINPTIGDLTGNKELILQAISQAEGDGIDLLLLPELVTSGYPPMDLLERQVFLDLMYKVISDILSLVKNLSR